MPQVLSMTTRRPRPGTTSGFENKKEFMSIKQFTKGPLHPLSHPCQSLEWFIVIDKESRINTRNKPAGVTRGEDAAAEFSILNITYGGRFHNLLRMFPDNVKSDCTERVYGS